jgi:hypothetical protein
MAIEIRVVVVVSLISVIIIYYGFKPKPVPHIPRLPKQTWFLGDIPTIKTYLSDIKKPRNQLFDNILESLQTPIAQVIFPERVMIPTLKQSY